MGESEVKVEEAANGRDVRVCGESHRRLSLSQYLTTRMGQRSRAYFTQEVRRNDWSGADSAGFVDPTGYQVFLSLFLVPLDII
ncbi:hypothetical protein MA16_Dca017551 [Dendrobium catenatum]|uniref:Uncharacterized protein n=1 Tax=Dendrobium catenatum TaxID=906689 RepID=A0A2I0W1X4_9ASPA|nr:hypothetical protein MA16_Dca017551 [Dendrobium catenatum]